MKTTNKNKKLSTFEALLVFKAFSESIENYEKENGVPKDDYDYSTSIGYYIPPTLRFDELVDTLRKKLVIGGYSEPRDIVNRTFKQLYYFNNYINSRKFLKVLKNLEIEGTNEEVLEAVEKVANLKRNSKNQDTILVFEQD